VRLSLRCSASELPRNGVLQAHQKVILPKGSLRDESRCFPSGTKNLIQESRFFTALRSVQNDVRFFLDDLRSDLVTPFLALHHQKSHFPTQIRRFCISEAPKARKTPVLKNTEFTVLRLHGSPDTFRMVESFARRSTAPERFWMLRAESLSCSDDPKP
jgi:hypothetical protein